MINVVFLLYPGFELATPAVLDGRQLRSPGAVMSSFIFSLQRSRGLRFSRDSITYTIIFILLNPKEEIQRVWNYFRQGQCISDIVHKSAY